VGLGVSPDVGAGVDLVVLELVAGGVDEDLLAGVEPGNERLLALEDDGIARAPGVRGRGDERIAPARRGRQAEDH
jgi:hypothetical protein